MYPYERSRLNASILFTRVFATLLQCIYMMATLSPPHGHCIVCLQPYITWNIKLWWVMPSTPWSASRNAVYVIYVATYVHLYKVTITVLVL